MKMKKEHFGFLEEQIKRFMARNEQLATQYAIGAFPNSCKVKSLYKRFIWDIYYSVVPAKWTCDNLYSYLDDSHIETALRKIIPEIILTGHPDQLKPKTTWASLPLKPEGFPK